MIIKNTSHIKLNIRLYKVSKPHGYISFCPILPKHLCIIPLEGLCASHSLAHLGLTAAVKAFGFPADFNKDLPS